MCIYIYDRLWDHNLMHTLNHLLIHQTYEIKIFSFHTHRKRSSGSSYATSQSKILVRAPFRASIVTLAVVLWEHLQAVCNTYGVMTTPLVDGLQLTGPGPGIIGSVTKQRRALPTDQVTATMYDFRPPVRNRDRSRVPRKSISSHWIRFAMLAKRLGRM